ncbi:hypothetical protein [Aureimonas glaciei]|uniref:hypothetical protein n=1 Tax=Aureimonas glaciei TaxID=1776957 RepID=UPI001667CA85|nr:hypothetical protein [Aureimonas glaciei]
MDPAYVPRTLDHPLRLKQIAISAREQAEFVAGPNAGTAYMVEASERKLLQNPRSAAVCGCHSHSIVYEACNHLIYLTKNISSRRHTVSQPVKKQRL